MNDGIEIVGAHINNLKSVNAVLPLRKATMVVGVSGSGKSSLLSDTLATEANLRMRRFLGISQPHLGNKDVAAFLGNGFRSASTSLKRRSVHPSGLLWPLPQGS